MASGVRWMSPPDTARHHNFAVSLHLRDLFSVPRSVSAVSVSLPRSAFRFRILRPSVPCLRAPRPAPSRPAPQRSAASAFASRAPALSASCGAGTHYFSVLGSRIHVQFYFYFCHRTYAQPPEIAREPSDTSESESKTQSEIRDLGSTRFRTLEDPPHIVGHDEHAGPPSIIPAAAVEIALQLLELFFAARKLVL